MYRRVGRWRKKGGWTGRAGGEQAVQVVLIGCKQSMLGGSVSAGCWLPAACTLPQDISSGLLALLAGRPRLQDAGGFWLKV